MKKIIISFLNTIIIMIKSYVFKIVLLIIIYCKSRTVIILPKENHLFYYGAIYVDIYYINII